jgi:hypothetical protein
MNISLELEHLKTEKIQIAVSTGSTNCTGVITAYTDTHIMLTQSSKSYSQFHAQWLESGVKSLIAIDKIEAIVYEFTREV